jgi:hypothetical protein
VASPVGVARLAGESRQATWGGNPEYYDEADLASEYDGDLSALTTADRDPYGGQEAAFIHADVAGMVASGVAVGAAGITWIRSRREGKHGHRSKD